jgi:large subunit ribosomal protein L22
LVLGFYKVYFLFKTIIMNVILPKKSKAIARYVRMSPFKVRRVANLLRGLTFERALVLLVFLPYSSSIPLLKVLRSAAANASREFSVPKSALYIKEILVSPGPILKRFRPRAQGRGFRIQKRTCHISVTVEERQLRQPVGFYQRKKMLRYGLYFPQYENIL